MEFYRQHLFKSYYLETFMNMETSYQWPLVFNWQVIEVQNTRITGIGKCVDSKIGILSFPDLF